MATQIEQITHWSYSFVQNCTLCANFFGKHFCTVRSLTFAEATFIGSLYSRRILYSVRVDDTSLSLIPHARQRVSHLAVHTIPFGSLLVTQTLPLHWCLLLILYCLSVPDRSFKARPFARADITLTAVQSNISFS